MGTSEVMEDLKELDALMNTEARQSPWFDKAEPVELKSGVRLIHSDFPVQPFAGKVLAEAIVPTEYKTAGGIVVPGGRDENTILQTGKVLAVCAPYRTHSGHMYQPPIFPGQIIYFRKFAGCELELASHKFLLLAETDIIGVENIPERNK